MFGYSVAVAASVAGRGCITLHDARRHRGIAQTHRSSNATHQRGA